MTQYTEQQRVALQNPVVLACETVQPLYGRWVARGVSCILTINRGYE